MSVYPNSATSLPIGDYVRTLVVYDCQTNSATPATTDILEVASFESPMNLNNRDRFKVIFDKVHVMNPVTYTGAALTAGSPFAKHMYKYKKINLEVINSGTGGTAGSIQTGGIFLLIIGLNNNGSTTNYYSRVRFTDA